MTAAAATRETTVARREAATRRWRAARRAAAVWEARLERPWRTLDLVRRCQGWGELQQRLLRVAERRRMMGSVRWSMEVPSVRLFCPRSVSGVDCHPWPNSSHVFFSGKISGGLDGRRTCSSPALDWLCAAHHTALLPDGPRRCGAPCAAAQPAPARPRTRTPPARLVRGRGSGQGKG
eukprot:scaffold19998_cov65-Phaeocystis_antarctica.AAC.1